MRGERNSLACLSLARPFFLAPATQASEYFTQAAGTKCGRGLQSQVIYTWLRRASPLLWMKICPKVQIMQTFISTTTAICFLRIKSNLLQYRWKKCLGYFLHYINSSNGKCGCMSKLSFVLDDCLFFSVLTTFYQYFSLIKRCNLIFDVRSLDYVGKWEDCKLWRKWNPPCLAQLL